MAQPAPAPHPPEIDHDAEDDENPRLIAIGMALAHAITPAITPDSNAAPPDHRERRRFPLT